MLHYFLIAVLAGPQMLPFPRLVQGSTFLPAPAGQSLVALHPQFRPVTQVLLSGGRLSFESQQACTAFAQNELKSSGGVQLLCQPDGTP
ncbi:hypothetical protein [Gluconobacter frateurii]|uniref:Uncharacterized protein n=1 Tax=Gluconobacter frateurii NRIC 0228 TaxID=1307946 RepID=A0ABQ0Q8Y5_9PROT|nr:hypothetical protein [Gluconobacter frateurii]GBR09434.1 hypothetical protein AA0228_0674 [Gluconobacter frateurii NRIC 0228]GLP91963.1 hypothetical protein GCM10007868_30380 [Gluconobacter frateurii]